MNFSARSLWAQILIRRKNVSFHGFITCLYLLTAMITLVNGIYGLAVIDSAENKMSFSLYGYILPFVSFILDHSTKKIYGNQEA